MSFEVTSYTVANGETDRMNSSELKAAGDPEDDEDDEEEEKKSEDDEDEDDDDDEDEEETWRVSGELHYRAAPKD